MIRTRLLTSLVGVPLLLLALFWTVGSWTVLVVLLAGLGVFEMSRLLKGAGTGVSTVSSLAVAAATIAPVVLFVLMGASDTVIRLSLSLGPFLASGFSLLAFLLASGERPVGDFAGILFGTLYPAWLFAFLIALRGKPAALGAGTVFWLMVVVWTGDAGAYAIGSVLKGWRPFPGISAGKTLSGFVGGFVVSVLAALALHGFLAGGVSLVAAGAMGAACAVTAQFGDLAESLIKRRAGEKDSGSLLPGHGGVLDRFDGVLIAGPVLYYCLQFFHP